MNLSYATYEKMAKAKGRNTWLGEAAYKVDPSKAWEDLGIKPGGITKGIQKKGKTWREIIAKYLS